jgi:hypothetical protein
VATPRLSIAGLMTIVGIAAIDCAVLVHGVVLVPGHDVADRSPGTAIFILVGVLPIVNVVGVGLLLALRRHARREQQTRRYADRCARSLDAAGQSSTNMGQR